MIRFDSSTCSRMYRHTSFLTCMKTFRWLSSSLVSTPLPVDQGKHILSSREGNLGIIELNRPLRLNAIDLDMSKEIFSILNKWKNDNDILLLLKGRNSPDRHVFCAGGDVVKLYYESSSTLSSTATCTSPGDSCYATDVFRYQYSNNIVLSQYFSDRQISICDGITMGAGLGMSLAGKYRIATEHTVMAMPECAIGLFTDAGATWFLTRLVPREIGRFIALTGRRLDAMDCLYTGLATHCMRADGLDEFERALLQHQASAEKDDSISRLVEEFTLPRDLESPPASYIECSRRSINEAFGNDNITLEDIFVSLECMVRDGDRERASFAQETFEAMANLSPTSLKVTLAALQRGEALPSFAEAIRMEFQIMEAFMKPESDFYEGVRSLLVDRKTKNGATHKKQPRWNPSCLDEVTREMVENHFGGFNWAELKVPMTDLDVERDGND